MMHKEQSQSGRHPRPFNSPLECGLRTLFILNAARDTAMDLQRVVAYDYLLVHSGDVNGGPLSLHPAVPHRGAELLVKRNIVQAGLVQMLSKELIQIIFAPQGFLYKATELTEAFINLLTSPYAQELSVRATWIADRFGRYPDRELETFITENVGRWGAEFERITALDSLEL